MKKIIFLSGKTDFKDALLIHDRALKQFCEDSPEFIEKYKESKLSIKELIQKAKNLSDSHSTLQIEREIDFGDIIILLSLTSPCEENFFKRLMNMVKK